MNEKFITDNAENKDFDLKNDQSDYENLIIRLKEIRKSITLLEKQYFDKV